MISQIPDTIKRHALNNCCKPSATFSNTAQKLFCAVFIVVLIAASTADLSKSCTKEHALKISLLRFMVLCVSLVKSCFKDWLNIFECWIPSGILIMRSNVTPFFFVLYIEVIFSITFKLFSTSSEGVIKRFSEFSWMRADNSGLSFVSFDMKFCVCEFLRSFSIMILLSLLLVSWKFRPGFAKLVCLNQWIFWINFDYFSRTIQIDFKFFLSLRK